MSSETELELQRALGRLESKMDAVLYEMRESNKAQDNSLSDHSSRLLALESWRTRIVAVGGAAIVAGGAALKLFAFTK